MIKPEDRVSVLVDNCRYEGWLDVHIQMSIDQLSRQFGMRVTDKFPGNVEFAKRLQVGQCVQVKIGDDLVCTGYITATPVSFDATNIAVTVEGKSKTVDLVDCCLPLEERTFLAKPKDSWEGVGKDKKPIAYSQIIGKSWHNKKSAEIIADLAAVYGLKTYCSFAGDTSVISYFNVSPEDTVFDSIKKLLRSDNLVVTDDEEGNVCIVEVGAAGKAHDKLLALSLDDKDKVITGSYRRILGGNVQFDASKRFSEYVFFGTHKGDDGQSGKAVCQDKGFGYDNEIKRKRILVKKQTGQASNKSCQERADFESRYQKAQFYKTTYTVQGWRQSNGALWLPNMLVDVYDSILSIDEELLIESVVFTLNSSGSLAELTVLPKEGYEFKGN